MNSLLNSRFAIIAFLITLFAGISLTTRCILLFASLEQIDANLSTIISMFMVGLFYDLVAAFYYVAPIAVYIALAPKIWFNSKVHKYLFTFFIFTQIYYLVFNGFSEWFFWDEFSKRFNFIAVDYLVYTKEVINNILESYPIPLLLAVVFLISAAIFFVVYKRTEVFNKTFENEGNISSRLPVGAVFLLLPILFFNVLDEQGLSKVSNNQYNNELAKNGFYSLFSAFRHNTLDYDEFYKTKDTKTVMSHLKTLTGFDEGSLLRVQKDGEELKPNVMLIMVESLSASYMGIYGDQRGWTPHLDKLATQSLFFDNMFATGTRTVRGMEAVTLSVPPTPGRSIVKRPDNHNLFSSGFLFQDKGYDSKFIYAGYGYFDNMNDFFANNGFKVIDRTDINDDEITFANVWGVCDEDLFDKTISEADKSYTSGKPFFSHVMTTSNHRPFTYPDGKIDIPSHTDRSGGVKYTDYAISQLLKKASAKPWFDNTIFVIVADHNGGSAGAASLPIAQYKIPLMLYAPKLLEAKTVHKLSSQIDVMPTLLSLLNWSYNSRFYGKDILSDSFEQRAFIGNYQKLGLYRNNHLTVLEPNQSVHQYQVSDLNLRHANYVEVDVETQNETDAITYYQSASYMFKNHLNTWQQP
ncbi:MAG: LTA synthase family protein [Ghiorsea sp.]